MGKGAPHGFLSHQQEGWRRAGLALQGMCSAEKEDKVERPRNCHHPWLEVPEAACSWQLTNLPEQSPSAGATQKRVWWALGTSKPLVTHGGTWFTSRDGGPGSVQVGLWVGNGPGCKPSKPLSLLAAGGQAAGALQHLQPGFNFY